MLRHRFQMYTFSPVFIAHTNASSNGSVLETRIQDAPFSERSAFKHLRFQWYKCGRKEKTHLNVCIFISKRTTYIFIMYAFRMKTIFS